MTDQLMSPQAFKWFVTFLTGALASFWVVWDLKNLVKVRNADRSDPVIRDRQFGYVIGILIGAVGVIGCLKFHDVL